MGEETEGEGKDGARGIKKSERNRGKERKGLDGIGNVQRVQKVGEEEGHKRTKMKGREG